MNDDLDRRLTAAGERWRAMQPPPPPSGLNEMSAAAGATWVPRRWAPVAAVAGIVIVLAVVAVPLALRRGADPNPGIAGPAPGTSSTSPSPAGQWPADTGDGVPVEGTGALFRDAAMAIMLCDTLVGTADLPQSSAGCGPVAVPTTGVAGRWLVHTTTGGQSYSDPVRVEGVYRSGVLAVNRVESVSPGPGQALAEPPVPCPPPAGGWPMGYGLPARDDGSSSNRLFEHVRANPDRFADVWEGHPDGRPTAQASYAPTRMVYVVGTVGDVTAARAELVAIYPGNLCVHRVTRSQRDLEEIARRLREVSVTPIQADVDVITGKVRVKVVALNPTTMSVMDGVGRDALLIEEPLLQWLD